MVTKLRKTTNILWCRVESHIPKMSKQKFNFRFKKRKEMIPVTYPEPARKSLYDVVQQNMKIAGRTISMHRVIYIGEHSFGSGKWNIGHSFQSVINSVNSGYCDEYLTGFLLYYPKYFCHIVEASEKTLQKHFELLFNNEEISKNMKRVKLLVAYHNINQRFLNHWTELTAKPPTLMEKIDPTSDLHATITYVVGCIKKLYRLGSTLHAMEYPDEPRQSEDVDHTTHEMETVKGNTRARRATISNFDSMGRPTDSLPEYQLLDFLLDSQYLQDIQTVISVYNEIPLLKFYHDSTWPIASDFVPKDVFDKDIDPITDIPDKADKEELLSKAE